MLPPRCSRLVLAASVAAFLAPVSTQAATLFWDGGTVDIATVGDAVSQGGSGLWNTTLLNWDIAPAGSPHVAWPNTAADEAVFGGVAGAVSLGVPITANRLTFTTGGYTIDNGGTATNTLTLGGTTPTVTVMTAGDTANISAVVTGSAGLVKGGAGTLTLGNTANTYTGSTTISAGTLEIAADTSLGAVPATATAGNLTLNGGTLSTTANLTLAANRGLALGASGGTFNVANGTTTIASGAVAGAGLLTKVGPGALVLGGTNNVTATGGVAITAGALQAAAAANLPNGGILIDGGTLRLAGAVTLAGAQVITIGATGGTIDQTLASKVTIPANFLTGVGTLTRNATANNVIIGASNTVQITGANPGFTGATVLNGGQVEVSIVNGLGTGGATNTITVNAGAELTASNISLTNPVIINAGANIGGDNGTSNFAGAVTVNGGFNVRLGDFYQTTTSAGISANRNLIISGAISGTGTITPLNANSNAVPTVGAGQTLFLNGNNSAYTSNINFAAGYNVAFGAANSTGTGSITVNSTAAALGGIGVGYDFGSTLPVFTNNRTGTTIGGVFGLNTTLASSTAVDLATLSGGGFLLGSQSAGTYAAATLGADGGNYRLGGGGGTLTLTATNVLTGANSLIVGDTRINGGGTVVLAGANDFTGTTTVNAGSTLQLNNNASLNPAAAAPVVNAGGALALSGGVTFSKPLNLTGTSGTASATNLPNALVSVSGTNTFSGQINAATGSNNVRASTGTGSTLNLASNVVLSGGGTANGFVFAGTGTFNQTGTSVISGGGSVFSSASGAITLLGNNTYTGKTQIQQGSIRTPSLNSVTGGAAASGLGAPTTAASGIIELGSTTTTGTLVYTGTGETTDRSINLLGTTGGAIIDQSGTGLLRFTTSMAASTTGAGSKTFTLQGSTVGTGEFAGAIVNNSATNLTSVAKTGTGLWTLSGLSTYTGTTSINQGTLAITTLNPAGTASSLGNSGTINLGSTTAAATLQYLGTGSTSDRTINLAGTTNGGSIDQAGTGTLQIGTVTATGAGTKTLTLLGSTTGVGVIGGAIANNSATSLTNVTKNGSGTWTLAGNNTYTGTTTISNGLLRIAGSNAASTGAVAVNGGGSLGGTGTVGGAVTVAALGGTDLRDGAVGTLTLNSTLTFNGTATAPNLLRFDLGANTVDTIAATGAVTANTANGALINFTQLAGTPLADGTYPLITSAAAASVPTGFGLSTTRSSGRVYALTTGTTGNIVQVTVGTAAAGPAAAVWGGTASNSWSAAENWYTDATSGTPTGTIPGVGSNVTFYTTNPVATNLSTTLGGDFEINNLTFAASATTAVAIAGTPNALIIDGTAANGNTAGNGISQLSTATHTISSRLGIGGAQTWTVAAGGGLTVSGLVFDGGTAGAALTKVGAGTLTLSNPSNTFSGDINVTEGVLAFGGGANGTVGGNGDPLSLGAGSKTITITNGATVRPTSTTNPTNVNTKRFFIGAGGGTFNVPSGVTFQLDDAFQFGGTGDLTVTGAGVVSLNTQAFVYSGNVLVSSGTLRLGAGSLLGTSLGRSITVNAGASLDAIAAVTAANVPLGIALNGGTISTATASGGFAQPIALTANSTVSAGAGFIETLSGIISGGFSLNKTGAGTVTLAGADTYTGGTNVTTGTVLVTGSIVGNVNVSANAILGGSGTVQTGAGGRVTVAANGVIAPGAAALGTLTLNAANTVAPALSLTAGATFTFELNAGLASDRIAITNAATGSVAFAGNTINFSDLSAGALVAGNYLLFTTDVANAYTGLTTDANGFITSGLTIGSGLATYPTATLQVIGNNIVLSSIPEPGSATMLFASLGTLLGLGRVRRRAGQL